MNSPWEPGIAQVMQRHGGSHHSVPKVAAPATVPAVAPPQAEPPHPAPLVPDDDTPEK